MMRSRGFVRREGGKKEEDGSKGDNDVEDDNAGEVEEREGSASLEDASNNDKIYGAIASGQGNNTTNDKAAKYGDYEEGRMVGIPQLWVFPMGHMEAIAELIMKMDIDCLDHLTNVTCQDFEDGTGFEITFYF